jgi:hypothetical protein
MGLACYIRARWAASRPSISVKEVQVLLKTSDKKTAWMALKRNDVGQRRRWWVLDGRLQTCGLESPKAGFKGLQIDTRKFIKREFRDHQFQATLCTVTMSPQLPITDHRLQRIVDYLPLALGLLNELSDAFGGSFVQMISQIAVSLMAGVQVSDGFYEEVVAMKTHWVSRMQRGIRMNVFSSLRTFMMFFLESLMSI